MVEEIEQETLETAENSELEQTEEVAEEVVEENPELKKAKELANNYRIRAEKAEALAKQLKKPEEKETPKNERKYSLEDIDNIATLSSIPKEDRPEVLDYAERKGIKPAEALNASIIKIFLKEQAEFRQTQATTSTGGGKRGASKASDEDLLNKANQGNLPDDPESIAKLIALQRAKK